MYRLRATIYKLVERPNFVDASWTFAIVAGFALVIFIALPKDSLALVVAAIIAVRIVTVLLSIDSEVVSFPQGLPSVTGMVEEVYRYKNPDTFVPMVRIVISGQTLIFKGLFPEISEVELDDEIRIDFLREDIQNIEFYP